MKQTLQLILCIALTACSSSSRINRIIDQKTNKDTTARVNSLTDTTSKPYVYYITPGGHKILLRNTNGTAFAIDSAATEETAAPVLFAAAGDVAGNATANDVFTGSVRPTVKTTYSSAPKQTYATIRGLYNSLKSKAFMDNLAIGHTDTRTVYEDRNVVVTTAYCLVLILVDSFWLKKQG
ncbi:MAG: hypothetical protein K2X48_14015 [Chitinophagaceae bacterium]|nr:hypothetical protein [Chitinophagaceae bacterium]